MSIGVHRTNMQADTCAYTPNPHVYTHRQAYTHRASHLSMKALDVCGVCIFSHGICWYSFSKPLAAWCVQLHCRFISLPTQQSLISPSGSYTAQHMIALHWGGGDEGEAEAISERMRGWGEGSTPSIAVMGDNNSPNCPRLENIVGEMCIWSRRSTRCDPKKGSLQIKLTPRHFLEDHFWPGQLLGHLTHWLKISVTVSLVTS